jgi:hypothetical protein
MTTHQLPPLLAAVAARHDHFQRGVVARQRFHRRADRLAARALQRELGAGRAGEAGGGARDVPHHLNAHAQQDVRGVERERLRRRHDDVRGHDERRRALQRVLQPKGHTHVIRRGENVENRVVDERAVPEEAHADAAPPRESLERRRDVDVLRRHVVQKN